MKSTVSAEDRELMIARSREFLGDEMATDLEKSMARVLLDTIASNAVLEERVRAAQPLLWSAYAEAGHARPALRRVLAALGDEPPEADPGDAELVGREHTIFSVDAHDVQAHWCTEDGNYIHRDATWEPVSWVPGVGEQARITGAPPCDRGLVGSVITVLKREQSGFHDMQFRNADGSEAWLNTAGIDFEPVPAQSPNQNPVPQTAKCRRPYDGRECGTPRCRNCRACPRHHDNGGCWNLWVLGMPLDGAAPPEAAVGEPSVLDLVSIFDSATAESDEDVDGYRALYNAGKAAEEAARVEWLKSDAARVELNAVTENGELKAELARVREELSRLDDITRDRDDLRRENRQACIALADEFMRSDRTGAHLQGLPRLIAHAVEHHHWHHDAEAPDYVRGLETELAALREGRPEPTLPALADSLRAAYFGAELRERGPWSTAGVEEKSDWFSVAKSAKSLLLGVRQGPVVDREELAKLIQKSASGGHYVNWTAAADAVISTLGTPSRVAAASPTREELADGIHVLVTSDATPGEGWFARYLRAADYVLGKFTGPAVDPEGQKEGANETIRAATGRAVLTAIANPGAFGSPVLGDAHRPGAGRSEAGGPAEQRHVARAGCANEVPADAQVQRIEVSPPETEAPRPLPDVLPAGTRARVGRFLYVLDDGAKLVDGMFDAPSFRLPDAGPKVHSAGAFFPEHIDWAYYRAQQAKTPGPEQDEALVDDLMAKRAAGLEERRLVTLNVLDGRVEAVEDSLDRLFTALREIDARLREVERVISHQTNCPTPDP